MALNKSNIILKLKVLTKLKAYMLRYPRLYLHIFTSSINRRSIRIHYSSKADLATIQVKISFQPRGAWHLH